MSQQGHRPYWVWLFGYHRTQIPKSGPPASVRTSGGGGLCYLCPCMPMGPPELMLASS